MLNSYSEGTETAHAFPILEKAEKPLDGDLSFKVLLLFKGFLTLKFWCLH